MGELAVDREAVVAAYIRRAERIVGRGATAPVRDGADDPDAWAAEAVDGAAHRGPPAEALALVLDVVRRAPDECLDYVAAGPLEDVVRLHGAAVIDALELAARREPRVREALGYIWLGHGDLPPEVLERVVQASGDAIRPLGAPRDGNPRSRSAT